MALRGSSNQQKRNQKKGMSQYNGTRQRAGRWISEIRVPKSSKRIWLGSHLSEEKAARAYDAASYCLKGEKGNFNFPNSRRPDLGNKPIGTLQSDEIRRIALEFSCLEETAQTPALLPQREMPPLVESPVVPSLEVNNQFCANKTDASDEPYIPRFAEEEPYDPAYVPDAVTLATLFLQLDEWLALDEDWTRNFP